MTTVVVPPKLVTDALTRIEFGESFDKAVAWVWQWADAALRNNVDTFLVAQKHRLAYEPGTAEQRFRAYVLERSKSGTI